MDDVRAADYAYIKDDLIKANDEKIISDYLKNMIDHGDSWPEHFVQDADVFNKDPREVFDSENPTFVIVKPRTRACGKTDGCDSGCWRIIGRDKLIKYEDTGMFLGFKKILKFCGKTIPREYKRRWVMEEYRVPSKWKQDHVICKIRLLFQTEIRFLLAKHFSFSSDPLPPMQSLPAYGFRLADPMEEDVHFLYKIRDSGGNDWPSYVANNVYCLHPTTLVDPRDQMFMYYGLCIFANRTYDSGMSDGSDSGCWRLMERDKLIKWQNNGIGVKSVLKFWEGEQRRYMCHGEEVKVIWIMEEYKLFDKAKRYKAICIIKVKFSAIEGN